MFFKRWDIVAGIIVGLGATGVGSAFGQSTGVARRRAPPVPRAAPSRFSPAATLMYNYVTSLKPGELKWQRIPWMIDLVKAIRQARTEGRPILLWVSGDDPLERC